jgi:Tfp pilus assembly PilM family ATPase
MSLKNWITLHVPTPRYMSMSHVGVDISPTCIHIAEINHKGSHLELGKYGVYPLKSPINYTEPLISNQELVEGLKELQKKFHLDFVEVSIPEELAYIFTTEVPQGGIETQKNHIELHLEENVPLTLADAVYDFHIIEKLNTPIQSAANTPIASESTLSPSTTDTIAQVGKQDAHMVSVSVSVVPRNIIDQYIELFETANMTPVSFLVENQALSKSIIKAGSVTARDMATKLIVHVGDRKSVLSVVSKGSVHFTSTVNIGSEDFTSAIMKEFNVSREEAIRMKTEKGTNQDNQNTIFMSLINTASVLKDEIDHIVLYWQSHISKYDQLNERAIGGVILSGQDALINGFKDYIHATVRLPVETANVWSNIYDLNKRIPHIQYIDSLDYAVAIGLALPRIQ